jgi:hypothetical protein
MQGNKSNSNSSSSKGTVLFFRLDAFVLVPRSFIRILI